MKYGMKNPFCSFPPGSKEDYFPHIDGNEDKSVSRAVFKEHRFSFFWWNRWTQEKRKRTADYIADVVTIDFHNDLHFPNDDDCDELKDLDLSKDFDISFHSWARLNGNSDDHVLSAAYLNIIGNVYALTKQDFDKREFTFKDKYEKEHKIFVFEDYEELGEKLGEINTDHFILDIDLDYFVSEEGQHGSPEGWKLVDDETIINCVSKGNGIIGIIGEKLDAISIATESDYTGGLKNSFKIFQVIEETLFDENGNWK
ncbi:MAG: hypothetical protein DRQ13_06520 [Ignavibacteriae bacterium]|nr:MAG: hypothetical protein DRQ13_06520 [Ignavibacteriota bacterium]